MDDLTQEAREALLADYALRRLDPARDAAVAAWLAKHPEMQVMLADYARISTGLLHTPEQRPVPADMKTKLMAQARAHAEHVRPHPLPERRPSLLDWLRGGFQMPRLAFGLSAFLVVGALAWMLGQVSALRGENAAINARLQRQAAASAALNASLQQQTTDNAALSARLEQQAGENVALNARLQQQADSLAVASNPSTRSVTLAGAEAAPRALANVRYEPNQHQGVLLVANLPKLPAGKQYQLWFFGPEGKPLPSVAFDGTQGTPVVFNAGQNMGDYVQFVVTIEPSGGLPAPSGPIALVGKA